MKRATVRLLIWLSGLWTALLTLGLVLYLAPLGADVVVLQLAFSPPNFGHIVHGWSPENLLRYRRHLPFGVALAICYGLFGYLLAARTAFFSGLGAGWVRFAKWSLPVAALGHVAANAFHLWLTAAPRFGLQAVYAASAGLSLMKWAMLIGFGLVVVYALLRDSG